MGSWCARRQQWAGGASETLQAVEHVVVSGASRPHSPTQRPLLDKGRRVEHLQRVVEPDEHSLTHVADRTRAVSEHRAKDDVISVASLQNEEGVAPGAREHASAQCQRYPIVNLPLVRPLPARDGGVCVQLVENVHDAITGRKRAERILNVERRAQPAGVLRRAVQRKWIVVGGGQRARCYYRARVKRLHSNAAYLERPAAALLMNGA